MSTTPTEDCTLVSIHPLISQPLRFFKNGQPVEFQSCPPTRTVLDWLREDAQQTGTKEGCNEGDCGACTVVVGTLNDAAPGGLQLRAINACLAFVPSLHGKALFTVEFLKSLGQGALHPVQQAMVDHHGSQCGFCTPGFVMSMWAAYENPQTCRFAPGPPRGMRKLGSGPAFSHEAQAVGAEPPSRRDLADALAGNLCRCTGYRPILDAAERMFDAPPCRLQRVPIAAELRDILATTPALLEHHSTEGRFFAPRQLDALADCLLAHPKATLLAGGTDVGLWVNKQLRVLPEVIHVGAVAELCEIQVIEQGQGAAVLHIGAAASLQDAWKALAHHWPALGEVWLRFASPTVRHAGTMGGNIANGSPIGDGAPVLMALDARLLLRRGDQTRHVDLSDFYLGYMKNQLQVGEFLQVLQVSLPEPGLQLRAYKVSKRFDSDISALCAGLAIRLEGDCVEQVRLVFGGMGPTVSRAALTEATLLGEPWNEATLALAQAALAQDFKPLSDLRATADYRLRVAQNLLRRFWLETRPHDPIPSSDSSVWPQRKQFVIQPIAS
jgi:xanthine dehydrogenase small subunit